VDLVEDVDFTDIGIGAVPKDSGNLAARPGSFPAGRTSVEEIMIGSRVWIRAQAASTSGTGGWR
jgi:hypothetical protein